MRSMFSRFWKSKPAQNSNQPDSKDNKLNQNTNKSQDQQPDTLGFTVADHSEAQKAYLESEEQLQDESLFTIANLSEAAKAYLETEQQWKEVERRFEEK